MSSKAKNSPKSSPKKPAAKKSDAGVSKPKAARTGKSAANAERFKKAETKTTKVALRGGSSKAKSEVEAINKNLVAARKDGKKKRLTALERTALEGSTFALRETKRKSK